MMNRSCFKFFGRYFTAFALLVLLQFTFWVAFSAAQTKLIVLPSERAVRADKGETAMYRKVVEYIFEKSGYYRIHARVWYNSGDLQQNESFFMNLRRNDGLIATPLDSNVAGPYRIVQDDPGPPHFTWRDCGLFHITSGRYALWLHHYALIDSLYPQFWIGAIKPDNPESVRLADSLKIVYYPSTDGVVSVSSVTRQKKIFENRLVDVVAAGEKFDYRIIVRNSGANPLIAPILKNELPDSILVDNFSLKPSNGDHRQLEWLLPDIAVGDSIVIGFTATALQLFPPGFTAIKDHVELVVPDDMDRTNNTAEELIYGYYETEPTRWTDLQISLAASTDSTAIINGQLLPIVKPDGRIEYTLTVQNLGPDDALALLLHQVLPLYFILEGSSDTNYKPGADSLMWFKNNMTANLSLIISVWGHVDPLIPSSDSMLISHAGVASTTPDSIPENNFSQIAVYVSHSSIPEQTKGQYDLQLAHRAFTDTSISVEGKQELAVEAGKNFIYQLTLHNNGPKVAKNLSLFMTVPDSARIISASLSPFTQNQDTLFWKFDSLSINNSIQISLTAATTTKLIDYPFALLSRSRLDAPDDTLLVNNFSQATVYAIEPAAPPPPPASKNFDLALQYIAITDTSISLNNANLPAVVAGKSYSSQITLSNNGPKTAKGINFWAALPNYVSASTYSLPIKSQKADTLFWQLDSLQAKLSTTIIFKTTVTVPLPSSPLALNSIASVQAELDTTINNNRDSYMVYGLYNAPLPQAPKPYIEAQPLVIQVGDSISVRVKVEGIISSWDLWIRFADGEVDSSYANLYIQKNPLMSGIWQQDLPLFRNTRLFTSAKEEQIVFELRVKDQYGRLVTAQSAVLVQSLNHMKLDRNVYEPDRQDPLAIQFKLSSNRVARIDVYDIAGAHICKLSEDYFKAGWNTFYWNGRIPNGMLAGSGVYIITIHSGDYKDWKKCMIVR